uniref:Uncharacterized protein n=1 Tax=Lactuca sativa TaxID=4236 RepID=A0A9R1W4D1_LACSA|nr:hypothetical protein LSAT_V11C300154840 [Lactuca sativa]
MDGGSDVSWWLENSPTSDGVFLIVNEQGRWRGKLVVCEKQLATENAILNEKCRLQSIETKERGSIFLLLEDDHEDKTSDVETELFIGQPKRRTKKDRSK